MAGPAGFGLCDEPVDESTHVLSPEGEIDAVTAPQLGMRLLGLAEEGKRGVVVNLSKVTFMDSTGLGVLLNAVRALAGRRGKLVLVRPNDGVMRPFQVTRLGRRKSAFPSRA